MIQTSVLNTICLASTGTHLDAALGLLDISLLSRGLLVGHVLGLEIFSLLDAIPKGGVDIARLCGRGFVAHSVCLSKVSV